MKYERAKALEAYEKYVKTALDAERNIRRLEREDPQNVGFDILVKSLPDMRAIQTLLNEVRKMWKADEPTERWQIEDERRENFPKELLDAENARREAFEESAAAIRRLLRHLEHLEQDKDNDLQNIAPLLRDFLMSAGGHGPRTIDLHTLTNFLTQDQVNDAAKTIAAGGSAANVVSEWVRDRQREEITATM